MHYHVINWSGEKKIVGALTYDNGAQSVVDFVDLCYNIFGWQLDEEDKSAYIANMVQIVDDEEICSISNTSPKLNVSWVSCEEPNCSFASYN